MKKVITKKIIKVLERRGQPLTAKEISDEIKEDTLKKCDHKHAKRCPSGSMIRGILSRYHEFFEYADTVKTSTYGDKKYVYSYPTKRFKLTEDYKENYHLLKNNI